MDVLDQTISESHQAAVLPLVPVNFIIPVHSFLLDYFANVDPFEHWRLFAFGEYCWSLLTYLELKERGLNVRLSNRAEPECINIAHVRSLVKMAAKPDCFMVSIKADMPYDYYYEQARIVQNEDMEATDRKAYYVPLWPQPGLIPRKDGRKAVRVVGYAGRIQNLLGGSFDPVREMAADLGLELRVLEQSNWNDYSEIDILVGVRTLGNERYSHKPATKLYNAWLAGVPFVGGSDSAFTQCGEPDVNFLRVETFEELQQALHLLKNDSALYRRMVAAGREASAAYTVDAIAGRWIALINETLVPTFIQWKGRTSASVVTGYVQASAKHMARCLGKAVTTGYLLAEARASFRARFSAARG